MLGVISEDTDVKVDLVLDLHIGKDGFILEPERWDETAAKYLAKMENIDTMSSAHWRLVRYIREFYMRFGVAPPYDLIKKHTRLDLKRINALFPGGLIEGACKVAGLPAEAWCWRPIR